MILLRKANKKESKKWIEQYISTLEGDFDSTMPDIIYNSTAYIVTIDSYDAALVCETSSPSHSLTCFYVLDNYLKYSNEIFLKAKELLGFNSGLLLSLDQRALATLIENQTNIKVESYNFILSKNKVVPPVFPMKYMLLANDEDISKLDELKHIPNLDNLMNDNLVFVYKNEEKKDYYGFGYLRPSIKDGYYELHTQVCDNYRHQGIGRSILIHLSTLCVTKGKKPVANCSANNISTYKTLYSAGFISHSSIIKVFF